MKCLIWNLTITDVFHFIVHIRPYFIIIFALVVVLEEQCSSRIQVHNRWNHIWSLPTIYVLLYIYDQLSYYILNYCIKVVLEESDNILDFNYKYYNKWFGYTQLNSEFLNLTKRWELNNKFDQIKNQYLYINDSYTRLNIRTLSYKEKKNN